MELKQRIQFLEAIFKVYPYEYKLATMGESERKFHDSTARRDHGGRKIDNRSV